MLDNETLQTLKGAAQIERHPAGDQIVDGQPCQAYLLTKLTHRRPAVEGRQPAHVDPDGRSVADGPGILGSSIRRSLGGAVYHRLEI